jgi:DNA uptake protein ComE-like DNA-binding protein
MVPAEQSGTAEAAMASSALVPAPQTARDAEITPPPTVTGSPTTRQEQPQVATIEDEADSAAIAVDRLVNINTATLEELNELRGARRIGRAIVHARPYSSIEDLLKKRVLNRTTFNRVKDQITVD